MKHKFGLFISAVFLLTLAVLAPVEQLSLAAEAIIYVDVDAHGAEDGTSWDDAFTTLQPALNAAEPGDQIWVAAGTYTPTRIFIEGDPRSAAFELVNGVALYGGFEPSHGDTAWDDRDWADNRTILSGDLNGDDGPHFANNTENSYHVLYTFPGLPVDRSTILDGFTITGGNANGAWPHNFGGGLYNYNYVSPTLVNLTITGNTATRGGGMYNAIESAPLLINCILSGNSASQTGGGIHNYYADPILTGCTLSGNAAASGGGMYTQYESSPQVTNSILWDNTPDELVNQELFGTLTVTYSDVQGGYAGEGNIDLDPRFVDANKGDYHLDVDSPCIDTGSNAAPNLPLFDYDGGVRILDGNGDHIATIDMGVDETVWYSICLPMVLR